MAALLEAGTPEVRTPPKKRRSIGSKDKTGAARASSAKKMAARSAPSVGSKRNAPAAAKPAAKRKAKGQGA